MKKLISTIFSVEFFFAMFLFVGYFKELFVTRVDLAVVFLALTIVVLIKRIIVNPTVIKSYLIPIGLISLFFAYLLFGVLYSPSVINSQDKMIKLTVLTLPAALLPFFLFKKKEDIKRFTVSIIVIAFGSALYVLPTAIRDINNFGFLDYGNGNYQGLARLTGAGLVLLMFYAFVSAEKKISKVFLAIAILMFTFVLLSTGSRMPLLAFVLVFTYYLFTSFKLSKGILYFRRELKYIAGLLLLLVPVLIYMVNKGLFATVWRRFEILITSSGGKSTQGRVDRYDVAFSIWGNNPFFGNGTGSYGYMYTGMDRNDYPHNILMELLAENGLVGLIIFISIFGYIGYIMLKAKKGEFKFNSHLLLTVWLLFSFYFLFNALVSGDINSNRMMFSALSTLIIICLITISKKKRYIATT